MKLSDEDRAEVTPMRRLLERARHLIDRARLRWRYQISQNPPPKRKD